MDAKEILKSLKVSGEELVNRLQSMSYRIIVKKPLILV